MNQDLFRYFQRELLFIRKMANEFAEEFPEEATALGFTGDNRKDPHVERIIQAFALIAGRIQHRLDEEFPEITRSLLELLYPHLVRPVPSLSIVQFAVDPELSRKRTGQVVSRNST